MLELLAVGPDVRQRCRFLLPPAEAVRLGRSHGAELPVPWESHLSRAHLQLRSNGEVVEMSPLPAARNPVFVAGETVESCRLRAGDRFVIGETTFYLLESSLDPDSPDDQPIEEVTFAPGQLKQVRFEDADRRIDVLTHLPEVIWGARTASERDSRLVNLLLSGIRHADAAAVVRLKGDDVTVDHWERRRETAGTFRPSKRLALEALRKRKQSVLQVWDARERQTSDYTVSTDVDWAFCTPVNVGRGETWGLYVAGRLEHSPTARDPEPLSRPALHADVKFAEIVAEIISSVQQLNRVEGDLSVLRQFLSPPILKALEQHTDDGGLRTELLEPRECDVTVLFCDLRGFSSQAEESADDLLGLLERVSRALEVMTGRILEHGGVTGDFLGDAVLGFWGWPFSSEESTLNACRAALSIRRAFEQKADDDRRDSQLAHLKDFRVGIGIAHGRAVAGKIGTSDRVSVTVFGPVVNLASRLETMTKQLRGSILLDEATAEIVRQKLCPADGRIRKLGRVQPFGLETPLLVSELLPPAGELPELTDEHLQQYEAGVEAFIAGDWESAYAHLHAMPPSDRAQDFLTLRIAEHNRVAPAGWDGVVKLPGK
jgi:adenylate cyclase